MKKGFTLLELLITVAVIVTLMSMTFRLAGVGDDATKRNKTVLRMQKIENALSGYYAAYGSYPPVPLHGVQDITLKPETFGVQSIDDVDSNALADDYASWSRVRLACRAQPVAAKFPYPQNESGFVKAVAETCRKRAQSGSDKYEEYKKALDADQTIYNFDGCENAGQFGGLKGETDWRKVQMFQFGLMSFILPRYLFMMNADQDFYEGNFAQWTSNNRKLKSLDNGDEYTWNEVMNLWGQNGKGSQSYVISNQPSQRVTARWMPNLEGIVSGGSTFYGVNTSSGEQSLYPQPYPDVYSSGGHANPYVLKTVTVLDGWGNDFYYYSPPPYQSYIIWSSGPDGKTFPPWIDLATLTPSEREIALKWMADDVKHLSN